jgi:hypothetical protein
LRYFALESRRVLEDCPIPEGPIAFNGRPALKGERFVLFPVEPEPVKQFPLGGKLFSFRGHFNYCPVTFFNAAAGMGKGGAKKGPGLTAYGKE